MASTDADQSFSKPIPAPGLSIVDGRCTQCAKYGSRQLVGCSNIHIAQIPYMHRDALQLQSQGSLELQSQIYLGTRKRFHQAGESKCMADRGVSGYRFSQYGSLGQGSFFEKQIFNAAVLPPQLYFEVQHIFAVAEKPKMAGLNDSCVNRANPYLM